MITKIYHESTINDERDLFNPNLDMNGKEIFIYTNKKWINNFYESEQDKIFELITTGKIKNPDEITTKESKNSALVFFARRGDEKIVKLLLDNGANVNKLDIDANTPLVLASYSDNKGIVKILLDYKANPNIPNMYGETPLIIATILKNDNIVKDLLEAGADVNKKDSIGSTSLLRNIFNWNDIIFKDLLEAGADPNIKNKNGDSVITPKTLTKPIIIDNMLEHGLDINMRDKYGSTILMLAIWYQQYDTINLLLKKDADITLKNNDGETAMSIAELLGNKDILFLLKTYGAKE